MEKRLTVLQFTLSATIENISRDKLIRQPIIAGKLELFIEQTHF